MQFVEKKTILYFVTEDWYFVSHRFDLAVEAKKRGYNVIIYTNMSKFEQKLKEAGFEVISAQISRRLDLPKDLKTLFDLIKIVNKKNVNIVHAVAIKPAFIASIALSFKKNIKKIYAISGLGSVFTEKSIKYKIMKGVILLVFKQFINRENSKVIVQNSEDLGFLSEYISGKRLFIIRGAGVDINKFAPKIQSDSRDIKVIMASRLLWSKGILEYAKAGKELMKKYPQVVFNLCGKLDGGNPNALRREDIKKIEKEFGISWIGEVENMAIKLQEHQIFVLPTYYGEGVPKAIIEACACGLPIVTTNTPGCNDIVQHNKNGLLVPTKNTSELSDAIESLIVSPDKRELFGKGGRLRVVENFSLKKITDETINLYEN